MRLFHLERDLQYGGVHGGTNVDGSTYNQFTSSPTNATATGSGSGSSHTALDSILGNSGQALGGISQIISAIKGYNVPNANSYFGNNNQQTAPGNGSMLWIIVGIVALLLLGFVFMRGSK